MRHLKLAKFVTLLSIGVVGAASIGLSHADELSADEQVETVRQSMRSAIERIDAHPECASFLTSTSADGSTISARDVLTTLLNQEESYFDFVGVDIPDAIAMISTTDDAYVLAFSDENGVPLSGIRYELYITPAFFDPKISWHKGQLTQAQEMVATLLHEARHPISKEAVEAAWQILGPDIERTQHELETLEGQLKSDKLPDDERVELEKRKAELELELEVLGDKLSHPGGGTEGWAEDIARACFPDQIGATCSKSPSPEHAVTRSNQSLGSIQAELAWCTKDGQLTGVPEFFFKTTEVNGSKWSIDGTHQDQDNPRHVQSQPRVMVVDGVSTASCTVTFDAIAGLDGSAAWGPITDDCSESGGATDDGHGASNQNPSGRPDELGGGYSGLPSNWDDAYSYPTSGDGGGSQAGGGSEGGAGTPGDITWCDWDDEIGWVTGGTTDGGCIPM